MPLYPPVEPYDSGHLDVGDGQLLWWEECGSPDGTPVVFLHGGPGGGISPGVRRLFDPARHRVVLFDQRGCGRSLPHASTDAYDPALNTTWHLVADIERLREARGVERWQVFGGSWGSALALAYAETHPERVTELVLRGIFTLRRSELDFFYAGGAGQLVPELYAGFLAPLLERGLVELRPGGLVAGDPIAAYHSLLFDPDPDVHGPAAVAWASYEAACITLEPDPDLVAEFSDPAYALAFARIENDYFAHGGWFTTTPGGEGQLIADAHRLAGIPGVIVQGRYDLCTPAVTAWDLHRAWPQAELVTASVAGHAWTEPQITEALVAATDRAGKNPAPAGAARPVDTLTDRTIALLRTDHDDWARLVGTLTADQLLAESGATEWTVAQALSHLGSGAEITLAALVTATGATDPRDDGFNQRVWDRWNALDPAEQARGAVESNERLVAALEALSPEQRAGVRVDLGFLPEPVGLSTFLGTRLDEFVQHAWDVGVAVDPDAGLSTTGAELLAEHLSSELGFFLGFIGRPDALGSPAVVEIEGSGYSLVVADDVRLVARAGAEGASSTAAFVGPLEAAMRLVTGRLTPARTPAGTTVSGNVSLDDLRRVFPGF